MDASQATAWMLPFGLFLTVIAGAAMLIVSIRAGWVAKAVAVSTIIYAALGGAFTTAPKWERLVLKGDPKGFELQIAKLNDELKTAQSVNVSLKQKIAAAQSENKGLARQIALVSQLNNGGYKSAADALSAINSVRSEVGWARFLPTDASQFRAEVPPSDMKTLTSLATELGVSPRQIEEAMKNSGITLIKNIKPGELSETPFQGLWLSPSQEK